MVLAGAGTVFAAETHPDHLSYSNRQDRDRDRSRGVDMKRNARSDMNRQYDFEDDRDDDTSSCISGVSGSSSVMRRRKSKWDSKMNKGTGAAAQVGYNINDN